MTNKTDPRLDVLLPLLDGRRGFATSVLNSMDAVDPKRRALDTLDALDPANAEHEALVERLADVLERDLDDEPMWSRVVIAKHILAALREAAQ